MNKIDTTLGMYQDRSGTIDTDQQNNDGQGSESEEEMCDTFFDLPEGDLIPDSPEYNVFKDYARVDARLIDMGWDTKPAKSVKYGKTDQSMLNHVRNGVFFLLQLNSVFREIGDPYSEDRLRDTVALFVSHDIHKLYDVSDRSKEFDIPLRDVEQIVETAHILDIAPNLTAEDHWCSARATHITDNSMTAHLTLNFGKNVRRVRVADAFASSESLSAACGVRTIRVFDDDPILRDYELRHHNLDDVKGILTNFINKTIADYLKDKGYKLLLIYDDGCVYIAPEGTGRVEPSNDVMEELSGRVIENIRKSHPIFSDPDLIKDNIQFIGNLGHYKILDKDFIYSGAERVVAATIRKGVADSFVEEKITPSMKKSIEKVNMVVEQELDETRQMVAISRIISTIAHTIVSKLTDDNPLEETCDNFAVSDTLKNTLLGIATTDPKLLTSGGKWEYSYAIANEYMYREVNGILFKNLDGKQAVEYMTNDILSKLKTHDAWSSIDDSEIDPVKLELIEYLCDTVSIDGSMSMLPESRMSDTFKEYSGSGKICTLCNRGTVRTKRSMEDSSMYYASFSNRVRIGKSKPEQLPMCAPCSMEMFLRKTGSRSSESGKLYIHLIPDYFHTPLSWELYKYIINKFSGDVGVQMSHLAKSVFRGRGSMEAYREWIEHITAPEKGRKMFESQMQQFGGSDGDGECGEQYGVIPVSFYKQEDNQTEFQFFGAFIALVVSAYTGMRCIVSELPVPTLRGRDFNEIVYFDSGNAQVKDLFGDAVKLSELDSRLTIASALIRLGYANAMKDSLFPKYLRAMRNKHLPGSYLLKSAIRNSENEAIARYYMDEAKYLDMNTGVSPNE
ncbi:MAG: type I-D CRISPR-associated protein Cas10d/Csc3 [Candidatus Methanogaster sp.]|uniref:Type I-D CRISPR-associated protein Cas10d/Csc3 n=1 Tax=Candidatus Methanogaster sp. TaxID=3386292 RepID=A0AC61KZE1_9EURY|nr:MAG: type I-D CRISPR-associated protein Cas10d/Csc3 [ANME-2 cluster archaeon]